MSERYNSLRKDHSKRKRKLSLDMARSIGNDKHLRGGNIPWFRPVVVTRCDVDVKLIPWFQTNCLRVLGT